MREDGTSPFRSQGRVSRHPLLRAARSLSAAQLRGRAKVYRICSCAEPRGPAGGQAPHPLREQRTASL